METALHVLVEDSTEPVVIIEGTVDFTNADQVRQIVFELVREGHSHLRLDLSGVGFIDSSGIAVLLDCVKAARSCDGAVTLVRPSAYLSHLLKVSHLASFFTIQDAQETRWEKRAPRGTPRWIAARFTVPCQMELAAIVRGRVAEIADALPLTTQEKGDIQIAVGEAVANAFRHGCKGREDTCIRVGCMADPGQLIVEITDPGCGFDSEALKPPVLEEVRDGGMGVHFMRLLMDEVEYRTCDEGCTVRLVKKTRPAPERSIVLEPKDTHHISLRQAG